MLGHRPTQKDQLLALAKGQRTQLVAHPILHHHAACHCGRPLEVVARAGRDALEDDFFGGTPAQQHDQVGLELGEACQVAVLFGRAIVYPPAMPRGMMLTFLTLSAPGIMDAARVWPAS